MNLNITNGAALTARALLHIVLWTSIGAATCVAQTTLVSNLGQSVVDWRAVGGDLSNPITLGMRFTTGDSGASVTGFTLAFGAADGVPSGFGLELYASFAEGIGPADLVATFTGPDPLTEGSYDFVGAATLSANTSYFLIATAPAASTFAAFSWQRTLSTAEDIGGAAGWTIGDTLILENSFFTWSEHATGSMSPLMFSVQGSAVPEPATWVTFAGAVALVLAAGWRRRTAENRPNPARGTRSA